MKPTIFVLDDEPDMIAAAKMLLEANGYAVASSPDPKEALNRIEKSPPDLLLLDIRMPEMDGFEVCKRMKSNPATASVPIVILSIHSEESNVVLGLGLGAEDYVGKPFRKHELLARIQTALRRKQTPPMEEKISIGPLRLNTADFSATMNRKPLSLELKEFELLAFFCRNEGRVLTRSVISERVWGREFLPTSRAIDVRINELRKKLGKAGEWIKGLRGIGYRFEPDED